MKKITLFILLFEFTFCFLRAQVKNVDPAGFKKMIGEKNVVLIDLRTIAEINSKGKIKDALQIDFLAKDSEKQIARLDKSKTYLLYCAGGGRSGDCAELMEKQGFKNIVNLEGGIDNWKRKGFEVEVPATVK